VTTPLRVSTSISWPLTSGSRNYCDGIRLRPAVDSVPAFSPATVGRVREVTAALLLLRTLDLRAQIFVFAEQIGDVAHQGVGLVFEAIHTVGRATSSPAQRLAAQPPNGRRAAARRYGVSD
jgi:hypothetical protein